MQGRFTASLALGALLAGGGAFHYLDGRTPARLVDIAPVAAPRSSLEHCMHSARMIFDVHWAAACTAEAQEGVPGADGNAECDLADDRASAVNAWLDGAEAMCMAEARSEPRH